MAWQSDSAAEPQRSAQHLADSGLVLPPPDSSALRSASTTSGTEIKVGKRFASVAGKDIEVFTMSLGSQTIDLLPLKTWAQLDLHKWRVQGKLPNTPAGLEVAFDHTKLMGETVRPDDPEGCSKLEHLFSEWLAMEREAMQAARRKAQMKAAAPDSSAGQSPAETALRFQVRLDKEGQVHIECVKGKEILATIGLNTPGFLSLVNQGWMRKPHSLKTGALHDWVELDGTLFSFEKGCDCSAELAKALNDSYLPPAAHGGQKEVVVYSNAASPTGFDVQFPAKVGGVLENRRRPLGEQSLALLQDSAHCGLLQDGLVIKLSCPCFIFKQKTPDGGERYLEKCPENLVRISDEDGEKIIDLSQPVNYLRLRAVDLTAVLNHPSINKHVKAAPPEPIPSQTHAPSPAVTPEPPGPPAPPPRPNSSPQPFAPPPPPAAKPASAPPAPAQASREPLAIPPHPRQVIAPPEPSLPLPPPPPIAPSSRPNLWIKPILDQQPIRFDWFTCLVYEKVATWFGNSSQATLLDNDCWFVQIGQAASLTDPEFKGVFDTRNGSFGFLGGNFMLRFENGLLFLGPNDSTLKAADVRLLAVGVDHAFSPVFIVSDGYRPKFGVPQNILAANLSELNARGATLMSVAEALQSQIPIEVIWTVPVRKSLSENPEAVENLRPDST